VPNGGLHAGDRASRTSRHHREGPMGYRGMSWGWDHHTGGKRVK